MRDIPTPKEIEALNAEITFVLFTSFFLLFCNSVLFQINESLPTKLN